MEQPVDQNASKARVQTPKYRDPRTGKTWSGRGRLPRWIEGENRTPFLINK
ncbi:DNA-binding protein Bv3F [Paraburkholderia ultramafica]|uniref:DNA-binding protein Bv3F n=1 Tax=Paraburkholderia ultramafica TaxID=1544867 RepID=A0A6S7C4G9_9BURK|nr:DNA-binding protein Bv3F [Paraburkholderia ultramafica]